MTTDDPYERQEVVVSYADLDKVDQFFFRRGVIASGLYETSDGILHEELLKRDFLRIAGFCPILSKTFSVAFSLGYCFGREMTPADKASLIKEKRNVRTL